MFSMAFAKLLISCAQELQSTSEMQTYTSKVESQYIKSPMNLVIVCKSFPEVAYVHLVFQFLAQTTKTTRSRPIPNWNRGLLMKPNQQWFRTKNRGYSENQIEPNIKKPLCHTWRVVPVWWQRCYLCYLYIQMLLVLFVHTDVTCAICTYRCYLCYVYNVYIQMLLVLFVRTEVVEFQQSSDRRTGKPIAVAVIRAPLKTSCEIISEKPSNGIVLAAAKAVKNKGVCFELELFVA